MKSIFKNAIKIKEQGILALFRYFKKFLKCDTQKIYVS